MALNLPKKPKQSFWDKVRDVVDANSQMDQYKRAQAGQQLDYASQQIDMGNNRPAQNIGQAFLGNTARVINTGIKLNYDTMPKLGASLILKGANKIGVLGNQDYSNAVNKLLSDQNTFGKYGSTGGLFNAGTVIDSPQQAKNLSTTDVFRKGLAYGAGTYGELSPVGASGGIAARTALGATEAAIGDIGSQYANNGKVNWKQTAQSAAFGAALPNVVPVSKGVARRVTGDLPWTSRKLTSQAILGQLDNSAQASARQKASVAALDSTVSRNQAEARFKADLNQPTPLGLPAPKQNFTMPNVDANRVAVGTEKLAQEYSKEAKKIQQAFKGSPKRMNAELDALDARYQARHADLIDGVGEFAPQVGKTPPQKPTVTSKKPTVTQVSSIAQGRAVEAPVQPTSKPVVTTKKSIQELVMGKPQEAQFGESALPNKGILERGASAVTGGIQNLGKKFVKGSLESGNKALRTPGRLAVGITKEAAQTAEETARLAQASGTKRLGQEVADTLYRQGADFTPESKARIGNALDPELATRKGVTEVVKLTPAEQAEVSRLRDINDKIHEENYKMGLISQQQYDANKGKYFGRDFTAAFDKEDLKQMSRSLGFDRTFFKRRTDLDKLSDEIIAAASEDPHLITAKRIQNLEANKAYQQQANWLVDSGRALDTPKSGYVKVSDSPKYGNLKGKYVLKEDLENLDGFIYDTKVAQLLNDAVTLYDRNPVRRGRKMLLTVLNPAVRLGNITSNITFGWLNGINPATMMKNWGRGKEMMSSKSPEYLEAVKQGIFGSSIMDKEFQRTAKEIGVERNALSQWLENRKSSYGATDDHAKMAAYIAHRERGLSPEQAAEQVRRGFQNYDMVGFLYDLSAKSPVAGKAFGRFGSELTRIMSNAVADRPLRVAGTLAGVAALGNVMSRASGETPEDRKTREERLGAPKIPFTDISLEFQTPAGAVNIARLMGITSYNDTVGGLGNEMSKLGPFDLPGKVSIGGRDAGGPRQFLDFDANPAVIGGDPVLGPLYQAAANRDFRNKQIVDSAAPMNEQLAGRARFLQQSYVPYMNEIDSLRAAANYAKKGNPDVQNLTPEEQAQVSNYYGKVRTIPQAVARTAGIKVEQFGPQEAALSRQKDLEFKLRDEKNQADRIIQSEKETARYLDSKNQGKGKASVPAKSAEARITPLSTGTFYVASIKDGKNEFDTEDEAKMAIAKDDFRKSDKKLETFGDTVFYKTKDGTVKEEPKIRYDAAQQIADLDLEMDRTKRSDNVSGWIDAASKKYDALEKQKELYDPETEKDEIVKIINKQEDLMAQVEKFQEQGGFKKGKAGGGINAASFLSGAPRSNASVRPTVRATGASGVRYQVRGKKAGAKPKVSVRRSKV